MFWGVADFGDEDEEFRFLCSITERSIIFNAVGFREVVPVVRVEVFYFEDYYGAFFEFFGFHHVFVLIKHVGGGAGKPCF
jgi:hypothetical protein